MENLTFYMWEGTNFVRKKSCLTAKRVKKSPEFERTRYYAGLMAQASRIGSSLFRSLPVRWRQSWMYRTFTGEALKLMKEGKTVDEATKILWAMYVKEVVEAAGTGQWEKGNEPDFVATFTSCSDAEALAQAFKASGDMRAAGETKRPYTKRNTLYWLNKTVSVEKRKCRKKKLQYYAGLLARASVIGSAIYKSLPIERRKHALYKALTGSAMELLKEKWADDEVKAYLMERMLEKERDCYTLTKACASTKAESDGRMVYKANPGKTIRMYGHHAGIRKRRNEQKRNSELSIKSPLSCKRYFQHFHIAHNF